MHHNRDDNGMTNRTNIAHYYEHYPHMSGTKNNECKIDIEELDAVSDKYKTDKNAGHEALEELALPGYASYELMMNWPTIRKQLENKGEWSGEWEEGSHGISMTSMKDARDMVGKIEAEVFERCGEW